LLQHNATDLQGEILLQLNATNKKKFCLVDI